MKRVIILASMAIASVASAATLINTFDLPAGPITADGVVALGVTFHFSGGSALYGNSIGAGILGLDPLSDPVLDGDAIGTLTLDFDQASTGLAFDFVLGALESAVSPGVTVGLSGPDFSGSTPLTVSTDDPNGFMLALGSFSYSGSPFTQAVITFNSSAQRFAMDNLTYNDGLAANALVQSPEPGTWLLVVTAGLLTICRSRRIRSLMSRV